MFVCLTRKASRLTQRSEQVSQEQEQARGSLTSGKEVLCVSAETPSGSVYRGDSELHLQQALRNIMLLSCQLGKETEKTMDNSD